MIGAPGSGKTTYAKNLCKKHKATHCNPDAGNDYINGAVRKFVSCVKTGQPVVFDYTN